MSTSNFPVAADDNQAPPDDNQARLKIPQNVIIVILGIAFLGMCGYLLISSNKAANIVQQNHT